MDFLPGIETFSLWLMQYGSFVLFILLTVGIIALPVPEETLMVIAGILMHKGKLAIPSTVLAAFLGSLCGITVSYWLGRTAGQYLITKYGSWVGLTEKRFEKAHCWFEKFGKWALLIGYFIPGVRHLTGLSAGVSNFSYRQFAIYAYTGALIWVSSFLSIGYFFGKQWLSLYDTIKL
ncbi:MAG: DedA family protein, partial [Rhabdochlamydiaceae bacterium]|nr:DedA family protein [Rhabdochlamydiaceae bacterium]